MDEQIKTYDWELKKYGPKMNDSMSAADKGAIVSSKFEVPADKQGEMSKRSALAAHFASLGTAPPVSVGAGNGATAAGSGAQGGNLSVTVQHQNPPPGAKLKVTGSDSMDIGPVIEKAMYGT